METSVQRLRYVFNVLAPAVGGKTLPILKNVVMSQGRAWATNLETAVTVEYPEATDDPVLLPHKQVLSLLRNIPAPTRITINREGESIKVVARGTSADFPVPGEVTDFPPLPKLQPIGEGQVDADLFLKTATALAGYAATAVDRPALQCVCITLGAPLEMAGADGFRLAWQTVPMALPALNSPVIELKHLLIPTTAVDTLARVWKVMEKVPTVDSPSASGGDPLKEDGGFRMAMLAVAKRMATIRFGKLALTFQHGAVTIRVQLTEGEFPNYHQLIPADLPNKVTFDAEEALRAVRSLAEVAADGEGIVRLQWSTDRLVFSAQAEEAGAITASVRAHIQGGDGKIAFNIKYLAEYLHGKQGMVLLETSAVDSPGRFFNSGSPDVLVMPMFVQGEGEPATEPAADSPSAEGPTDEEALEEQEGSGTAGAPAPSQGLAVAKPKARSRRAKG